MRRGTILFLGLLLALLAGFAMKDRLLALPPVAAEAPPGAFDANRAFARLERILEGEPPHPVDSDASDLVPPASSPSCGPPGSSRASRTK
jgi:hypothetical protein